MSRVIGAGPVQIGAQVHARIEQANGEPVLLFELA
jgi:hypothetical protein